MLAESSRQWRCSGIESWNMLSCAPGTVLARPYRAAPGKGLQLTDRPRPPGRPGNSRTGAARRTGTQAGDARSAGTRLARQRRHARKRHDWRYPRQRARATPTNGTWSGLHASVHIFLRRQADPGADDRADQARLDLSDTQFSLLHGLAFSLFYAFMGIPIALLADRYSRPRIIAIGVAFWSLATAVCGLSRNFAQMFWRALAWAWARRRCRPPPTRC